MKTLRLPLKKKWFEMTKDLIKGEDYRELTPYWAKRLTKIYIIYKGKLTVTFKEFDTTTLTLGYPSNSDKERIIEYEQLSISIGYGKEEWGAEKDKLYFVIKHGKRIN